jgi:hypothetical protein
MPICRPHNAIWGWVGVEELFSKLQQHYQREAQPVRAAPGYDPGDVKVVFGG